jgi:hypothetical protein
VSSEQILLLLAGPNRVTPGASLSHSSLRKNNVYSLPNVFTMLVADRAHHVVRSITCASQLLLSRTGVVKNYGRPLEQKCGADAGTAPPVFDQISMALEKGLSSSLPTVS